MYIKVRNVLIFIILVFILISCASGPRDSSEMSPALFESGEISQRAGVVNEERMVAYSVSLDLSVKNTDETRGILIEQVKNYKGFIVKETEKYIITRIPAENMENFISNTRTLGKVENETKTGTDITDQYRDNVIRLESLKNVRDRYLALLEKANTVSEILDIEKELERVNIEIEILEGKIKYAELSVTYSNITVRFKEKTRPGPV